jgi:glutamate-1-semialdehyde 2,1-aminomutase
MKSAQWISDEAIAAMLAREHAHFLQRNPNSQALAARSARHWLRRVPMFWMEDWRTPFPLFIERAAGVELTDADGNLYVDFCLGDTGAMFGHGPERLLDTLCRQGERG